MGRQKAIEYIEKTRQEGFSESEIRTELIRAGWPLLEIDMALMEAHLGGPVTQVQEKKAPLETPALKVEESPTKPLQTLKPFPGTQETLNTILHPSKKDPVLETFESTSEVVLQEEPLPEVYHEPAPPVSLSPRKLDILTPAKLRKKEASLPSQPSTPPPVFSDKPKEPIAPQGPAFIPQAFAQQNVIEGIVTDRVSRPAPMAAKMDYEHMAVDYAVLPDHRPHLFRFAGILSLFALVVGLGVGTYALRNLRDGNQQVYAALNTLQQAGSYAYTMDANLNMKEGWTEAEMIRTFVPEIASFLGKSETQEQEMSMLHVQKDGFVDHGSEQVSQLSRTRVQNAQGESFLDIEKRKSGDGQYFFIAVLPKISSLPFNQAMLQDRWIEADSSQVYTAKQYWSSLSQANIENGLQQIQTATDVSQDTLDPRNVIDVLYNPSLTQWERTMIEEGNMLVVKGKLEKEAVDFFFALDKDELGDFDSGEATLWLDANTRRPIKSRIAGTFSKGDVVATVAFSFENRSFEIPHDTYRLEDIEKDAAQIAVINLRDQKRISDLKNIQGKLQEYYKAYHAYPQSLEGLTPEFLADIPKDPFTKKGYTYVLKSGSYRLSAQLENTSNEFLSHDLEPKRATLDVGPHTFQN